ncbi:hypothetical protein OESDEN_14883 [Oesophagostomum dentatum]|uniref:Uncharacterized protein n=1 Tax=Oesophagostomum dentatum TaxID=61180 RepID=A0A0B1SJ77_OESDE|nr:hypothetical protein OESDEN_14883 [Oesophagostomum dentatum]
MCLGSNACVYSSPASAASRVLLKMFVQPGMLVEPAEMYLKI